MKSFSLFWGVKKNNKIEREKSFQCVNIILRVFRRGKKGADEKIKFSKYFQTK